MYNIKYTI